MFESYAADKNYKSVKKKLRSLKMSLDISGIGLQDTSLEQKRVLASVDTSVFSELNLETSEGDLVRLSFAEGASLSELLSSEMQTRENDTSQKFSSIARATASYSLTVEGALNSEELDAINKLVEETAPLAREFFAGGKLNLGNPSDILGDSAGALVQLELSLERTVVRTFETKSVMQFPGETDEMTNMKDLPSQLRELEKYGVRDCPALVQATIDAVFKSEAEQVPVRDSTPRSLDDLLAYIRDRIGEFFNSSADIDSLSMESISNTNGVVDDENSTSALGVEPFALKI
jgi:hypothetical protein